NRKSADAIGDEIRCVLGSHNAFAEVHVAEVGDGIHRSGIGFWRRNHFQKTHVTRGIEKVCTEPESPEVVGKSFGDFAYGKTTGVRGDNRAGLAYRFYFLQQRSLDF